MSFSKISYQEKKKYKNNKFDAIHYMKLIHLQTKKKQNIQTNLQKYQLNEQKIMKIKTNNGNDNLLKTTEKRKLKYTLSDNMNSGSQIHIK